mmetsp:Transcript_33155/g.61282  ORF Transcript_33155/g.61282 Transcript_33155/m.61282 type:complete len:565 (-) Transcript_33155:18-1712(-)
MELQRPLLYSACGVIFLAFLFAEGEDDACVVAESKPQKRLGPCPEATRGARSSQSGERSSITFVGALEGSWLFWVSRSGVEQLWADMSFTGPEGMSLQSFVGNVWRVRGLDGRLRAELTVRSAPSDTMEVVPCIPDNGTPGAVAGASDFWSSSPGRQRLTDCLSAGLLSEVPVPGFHVVCISASKQSDRGSPVWQFCAVRDGSITSGDGCSTPIAFTLGGTQVATRTATPDDNLDLAVLQALLAAHLKLKGTQQEMKIFTSAGRHASSTAQVLAVHRAAFVLVEDGVWHWPPVRLGYERSLGTLGMGKQDVRLRTLALQPRVFEISNFLAEEECVHIVQKASPHLQKSKTFRKDKDVDKNADDWRGSLSYFLPADQDPTLLNIDRRVQNLTRVPILNAENPQILRYDQHGFYHTHEDALNPRQYVGDQAVRRLTRGGTINRMLTVFMYLSNVTAGGETAFPRAGGLPWPEDSGNCEVGIKVHPVRGKVILFYNMFPDGSFDSFSAHGGCKVQNGTKWSANFWFWNGPQFYKVGTDFEKMASDLSFDVEADRHEERLLQSQKEIP